MSDNAEQIEFWNGSSGARWVKHQGDLDRALEPFGRVAMEAAGVRSGERVVDVGCGCGATTLALADAVGAGGGVLGVDVSAPMLEGARERARAFANTTFALGDATTHRFEASFDLVFSRFGVMFFSDPTAAFTNLRRALRPGGRLAFVCWGPVADNPWFRVPMAATGTVLPLPPPSLPEDPGPFAFGERARVQRILESAGFGEIAIEPSSPEFVFGPDLDSAATFAIESGSAARLLVDADEATRVAVRARIRAALEPHLGARGVVLASATWVVRARAPAG